MAGSSGKHTGEPKRNPLIPIGFAILAVLVVPPFIYSVGPKGPIKKDNVVFYHGPASCVFRRQVSIQNFGVSRLLRSSGSGPIAGAGKCRGARGRNLSGAKNGNKKDRILFLPLAINGLAA